MNQNVSSYFTPRLWRFILTSLLQALLILTLFGWQTRQPKFSLLIMAIAVIVFCIGSLFIRPDDGRQLPKTLWFYLGWMAVSTILSTYYFNSIFELVRLITYILIVITLLNHWSDSLTDTFFSILTSLGLVAGFMGIYDFFQLSQPFAGIAGTFGWRNTLAGWILLIIPITLGLSIHHAKKKGRVINALATTILLTLLFLTFSQASWISFIIILIIFFFFQSHKRLSLKKLAVIVMAAVILSTVLIQLHLIFTTKTSDSDLQQSSAISATSLANRLAYWDGALAMWQNSPWSGVGLGNFPTLYPRFQNNLWTFSSSPHNSLLLILTETGAIGLVLWIFFLSNIWQKILRVWKKSESRHKNIILLLGLSLLGSFLKSLLDFDWEVPAIALLWWFELGVLLFYLTPTVVLKPRSIGVAIPSLVLSVYIVSHAVGFFYLEKIKLLQEETLTGESAKSLIKKIPNLMPENAETWQTLSYQSFLNILAHDGNRETESYRLWNWSRRALRLDKKNAKRHYFHAQNLRLITKTGDPSTTEIEKELQTAIELDPFNHPEFYQALTEWYIRSGQPTAAIRTVDQALLIYTDEALKQIFSDGENFETLQEQKERIEQLKNFILENWRAIEQKNFSDQA